MRLILLVLLAFGCWAQQTPAPLQPLQAAWRRTMTAEIGDEETLDLYASQVMERCEAMRSRALTLRNLLLVENSSYEVRREQFFNAGMLAADYLDLLGTKYRKMALIVALAHRPATWRDRQEVNWPTPQWPQWGLDAYGKATVLCREIAMLFGKSSALAGDDLPTRLSSGGGPAFHGLPPPRLPAP